MSRSDTDDQAVSIIEFPDHTVEITKPREVPLGGLRALTVRRTLPNRQRTTIGPWCFLDHYGPNHLAQSGGMHVPPHPHTGLQTVSWLFEGTIEHQDSTGAHAMVKPGVLNLMTAGAGVQHSEVSLPDIPTLHGVQLWVVLPDDARHQQPHFVSVPAQSVTLGDATVSLFIGSLPGLEPVDAPTYWPMFGAEIVCATPGSFTVTIEEGHETGILVDQGSITIAGHQVDKDDLAYIPPGATSITVEATAPSRLILIGGKPFEEAIVMWWNFIGRTHEEIVAFREQWQNGLTTGSERFSHLDHLPALPAPEMPSVRLRARSRR